MKIHSFVVGPFQENAYLVVDETTNRAVLVDPGDEPERLVEGIRSTGATLDAIWLTHAHLDHIGGISGLRRAYDVPVLLHELDLEVYRRGAESAATYGVPFEQPEDPDKFIAEGDVLNVGSVAFDVLHTPGHAPGHVVFKHDTLLIGGDLLFAGSIGRTDLAFCNPAHMEESLARVAELDARTMVLPGHGPRTTIGHERATNGFLTGAIRLVKR